MFDTTQIRAPTPALLYPLQRCAEPRISQTEVGEKGVINLKYGIFILSYASDMGQTSLSDRIFGFSEARNKKF